ncbi:MAG: hypothetical protein SVW57_12140 [Thermodesulfobacteriota bacterium]|nr:hypothetical protein [Thermodesulfobacteriota bacterium]
MGEERHLPNIKEKCFDKRFVERYIEDGIITESEYKDFLESLPDLSDKMIALDYTELEAEKETGTIDTSDAKPS